MKSRNSMASLVNLQKSAISQHLQEAKDAAYTQRLRISGITGCLGILLALLAAVCFVVSTEVPRRHENLGVLLRSVSVSCLMLGLVCFLLALLPTDRRAVPVAAWILVMLLMLWVGIALNFANSIFRSTPDFKEADRVLEMVRGVMVLLLATVALACAGYLVIQVSCRRRMAKRLLSRMWQSCAVVFAMVTLTAVLEVTMESLQCQECHGLFYLVAAAVSGLCTLAARNSDLRPKIQNWLGTRGESAGSAAAVAALLGRYSVDEVLALARRNFFTIRADKVEYEHFANSEPNPSLVLGNLAKRTRLGEADAFISHSWRDDPEAKWAALQEWRERFKQTHLTEPKLWMDKYCIDQNDVENSLACLPIYLASCSRLVVICGETYLSRLWCIIELFVFLEMGGSPNNLEVILLPDQNQRIAGQIANFEPTAATCSQLETTDMLQSVLEAGSSGLEGIKELIRKHFKPAMLQGPDPPGHTIQVPLAVPLDVAPDLAPDMAPDVAPENTFFI
ncbi:unnamed protein product [Effrenium voratum]|nr:unnamed protein product [Effrenium voratum]